LFTRQLTEIHKFLRCMFWPTSSGREFKWHAIRDIFCQAPGNKLGIGFNWGRL